MDIENSLKNDFWKKVPCNSLFRKLFFFGKIYALILPLVLSLGLVYTVGTVAYSFFPKDIVSPQFRAEMTSAYWAGKDILSPESLNDYEFNYNDISYLNSYRERITHLGCKAENLRYSKIKKLDLLKRMEVLYSYRAYAEGCIKNKDLALFHLYRMGKSVLILERFLYKRETEKFYVGTIDYQIKQINREWLNVSKVKGWRFLSKELIKMPENKVLSEYRAAYKASRKLFESELGLVM